MNEYQNNEYDGPASFFEKRSLALLDVIGVFGSSSTFCCKLSTEVLVITWRPFASIMACLCGFVMDHDALLLQRMKDRERQKCENKTT